MKGKTMNYAEQTLHALIANVRHSLAEAIEEERNVGSYESALQREYEQGSLDMLVHFAGLLGLSVEEETCDHTKFSTSPFGCTEHPDKDCYENKCDNCSSTVSHAV
jgi:hypothetical protein